MSPEKQEPSAMAHTPLLNVPVKPGPGSGIRPLSLSKSCPAARLLKGAELTSSTTVAPDPRDHDSDATLQNVIVRRTEYTRLKDRNNNLEEQYRAISTSYGVLCQGIREVEAQNEDLEKRIQELQSQLEAEHQNREEYARRELLLRAENESLKVLLSQMGGTLGSVNMVRGEGVE